MVAIHPSITDQQRRGMDRLVQDVLAFDPVLYVQFSGQYDAETTLELMRIVDDLKQLGYPQHEAIIEAQNIVKKGRSDAA